MRQRLPTPSSRLALRGSLPLGLCALALSWLCLSGVAAAQPARPAVPVAVPVAPGRTLPPAAPGQPARPARPARPAPPAPSPEPPATPPATPPGTPPAPGQQVQTPAITSLGTAAGAGATLNEFEEGIQYQPLPPGARITFNLQDADLPDLIRAIGNITGRRFILPGKVRSIKTTIYSPTKVTPGEAYQAFLSVLEVNGMTVVPSGRYLKVIETAGSATQVMPTYSPGQAAPSDDRYITRIVRLRNIAADDAANVLGHFKSRDGDITPYTATNTLIITDNAGNIRRMMQILAEVDVPSVGEQIWVEPVHYALASELATRINEILGGGQAGAQRAPGQAAPAPDLRLGRILADDRSNALVVVATQRMYLRVLELLRRLDVSIEGEGQLRVLRLQHADAEEMTTTLNNIASGGRQSGAAQGQSARGQNAIFEGPVRITADKPSNALIVTSSPRDYMALRRVIDELDRSRRQVFIEAVVMELNIDRSNTLGLNFHAAAPLDETGQGGLALGGFNALNSILLGQDALSGLALGVRGPQLAGSQNLIPGVGVSIPGFGVTLNALASSGDANVLSTPHIIATDNSPADINVGQNVPLQTNLGGLPAGLPGGAAGGINPMAMGFGMGGFAAPRQDVGTKIKITPHINDSNEVRLEIDEEISEVGASSGGSLGAVSINRRTAKTVTVVHDQNTVVIGGLIRTADTYTDSRIPILGDIPILGALFRRTQRRNQRSNLLLFLTPYVIRDQSDLRRIFERKMRERQEFLDRYFVFTDADYEPPRDWTRTNGLVEEIRQSMREVRTRAEFESSSRPRSPPPHTPSESIDLPAEVRGNGATGNGTTPASTSAPAAPAVPMAIPVLPFNAPVAPRPAPAPLPP